MVQQSLALKQLLMAVYLSGQMMDDDVEICCCWIEDIEKVSIIEEWMSEKLTMF